MRLTLSALLFPALLLASCSDSGEPGATETVTSTTPAPAPAAPANPESSLGADGTGELMGMLRAYFSLKDALVATDGVQADEAASKLMSAAELFHSGMGAVPKKEELQKQLREVMSGSEAIMATGAEAVEDKRAKFSGVSDAVYQVAKLAELKGAGAYQQYCPMAFNDKGAYWLSDEEEIKNPYFGKKMLECGVVKDSL